ncbi:uncharacterized protein LOC113513955 [Galleria mellonella]|uniref:Odorant receptor n=1 Tax=Galleria mellonella TaxID=7137 RepID=A0ABM3MVW6_GALME|nr:uncharacterized protein LOC113513955 [Galleria mellonella]
MKNNTRKPLKKSASCVSIDVTRFFNKINKIFLCYGVPIIWIHHFNLSKIMTNLCDLYRIISNIVILMFVAMEWGAFFTQNNLTDKQRIDRLIFNFTHPYLLTYILNIECYKEKSKLLLYTMMVTLKKVYNDVEVEKKLIKKCSFFSTSFFIAVAVSALFFGIDAYWQVITTGSTFIKPLTAWPDLEDRSTVANMVRIINYMILFMLLTRVSGVYVTVVLFLVCLSHQYTNLNRYFFNLRNIFGENLSQMEKEKKYEEALTIGIELHSQTMWCTRQCESIFNAIFSFQIILNVMLIVLLMLQMMSPGSSLVTAIPLVSTGVSLMYGTGFFMWNAGDITVEASQVATALYCSGWENCHISTLRIRHLLLMTIRQAQKPEIIKAFGLIPLSYESYVSIVKAPYTIFSVIH